jgi:aspartate aminotransferase
MKLANRLRAIKPSPTLALNARAKALAAAGEDVVGFAAGEPDFDTPAHIKRAAVQALDDGFTKYTATAGTPELRAAICEKLKSDNGLTYVPEQVVVGNGAKHCLYNFFQALLDEGDEVIIFNPAWMSYPEMVALAGGTPVFVPTREEEGWVPDPELFARAITPRTRAVVLNSPSNPTGAVLSAEALSALARVLERHPEVVVVTDDIYEKLLYTGKPFVELLNVAPQLADRTLVVNGLSKAFAMTGWRLGYAAGPKQLISAMQMIQDQSTSNASSIGQRAAVAALQGPKDTVDLMAREFLARRDLFVAGLRALPGVRIRPPDGAFYVFPSFHALLGKRHRGKHLEGSLQISQVLLDDYRLAAVPGEPFGGEGHLRLSFAASRATIEKGLARLRDFVGGLTA